MPVGWNSSVSLDVVFESGLFNDLTPGEIINKNCQERHLAKRVIKLVSYFTAPLRTFFIFLTILEVFSMSPRSITYFSLLGLIPIGIYTIVEHPMVSLALLNVIIIFGTLYAMFADQPEETVS